MSLVKAECKNCWLPPDTSSQLCRRCTARPQKQEVSKIRFSHTPTECQFFRARLHDPKYFGNTFPEECLPCVNYLFTNTQISDAWKGATANFIFFLQSEENLRKEIKCWLKQNHELTLEVLSHALHYFHEDTYTSKKILLALVTASGKKNWILQELILRPSNLGFLLANPMILPGPFPEDLWGYFETVEEWWSFWQDLRVAAKRKIKFRSLNIKEELMMATWHPDRFLRWCLDLEELLDLVDIWPPSSL